MAAGRRRKSHTVVRRISQIIKSGIHPARGMQLVFRGSGRCLLIGRAPIPSFAEIERLMARMW